MQIVQQTWRCLSCHQSFCSKGRMDELWSKMLHPMSGTENWSNYAVWIDMIFYSLLMHSLSGAAVHTLIFFGMPWLRILRMELNSIISSCQKQPFVCLWKLVHSYYIYGSSSSTSTYFWDTFVTSHQPTAIYLLAPWCWWLSKID